MAQSGYAVVLSRWENRAIFLDLQGLAEFTRKYFASDQAHYNEAMALRGGSGPERWPWTFEYERTAHGGNISIPVVADITIRHPTYALAGQWGATPSENVKVHIASIDGVVSSFSIGALGNASPGASVQMLFQTPTGPNPVAMQWQSRWDGSRAIGAFNNDFAVLSRAAREVAFIHATDNSGSVTRRIVDQRMVDPVALDINNVAFANIVSVGDWTGRKVINYRIGATDGQLVRPLTPFPVYGGGDIECAGETQVNGNVYRLSFGNIP